MHDAPQQRTMRSGVIAYACGMPDTAPQPPTVAVGPVHCTWMPHLRGTPATPLATPWLAAQLDVPESALGVWRDTYGRPHLDTAFAGTDVNWSHSGEHLLVALGNGVRIGADLELLRPRPRAMVLAERFFTPSEARALHALPDATRETAFVRLWCAKEAVLKAHGRGIAFGLERLEFVHGGDAWRLHACDPALGLPSDWSLHTFAPMPGYLATLAWRPSTTTASS